MHDISKVHWQVARYIMRYILGIMDFGLKFEKSNVIDHSVFGYVDLDYVGDLDKYRSTACYVFTMVGESNEFAMHFVVDGSSIHYRC